MGFSDAVFNSVASYLDDDRQGLSLRWAVIGIAEKYDDLGSSDRAGAVFVSATMMIDLVVVHIVAMLVLMQKMMAVVGTTGVLLLGMFRC